MTEEESSILFPNIEEELQFLLGVLGVPISTSRLGALMQPESADSGAALTFQQVKSLLCTQAFGDAVGCHVAACTLDMSNFNAYSENVSSMMMVFDPANKRCLPVMIISQAGGAGFEVLDVKGKRVPLRELVASNSVLQALLITPLSCERFDDAVGYKTGGRYSWFWQHVTPYWKTYLHVMIASVVIGLLTVLGALFTMNVYDRVVPNNAFNSLWVLAIGVLVAYAFDFILKMVRGVTTDWAGKQIDLSVSSFLFNRLIGIKFANKPASTGVMANHMRDFDSVRDFFTSLTLLLLVDMPFLGLYLFVIFYIAGTLVIVPLVAIPVVLLFLLLIQKPLHSAIEKSSASSAQKHGLLIETLNGLLDLKLLGATNVVGRLWDCCAKESSDFANKSRFWSSLGVNFSGFVQQMVQVFLVVGGVYLIADGQLTMGGLIACSILNGRVMAPLGQLVSIAVRMQQTWQSLQTLTSVVEKPVDRDIARKYIMPPTLNGNIHIHRAGFSYSKEAKPAFEHLDLNIRAGEKVAVIGRTGGGKTTLLNLMCGLYEPDSGAVYLDNRDMRQIDPTFIRQRMIVVSQSPFLMSGSVRENLCLGMLSASDDEMLNVAKVAMLDDFVAPHPQGYDMQIGEGGCLLSGGQKQSLAIARSLLTDGEIVLLDEPTSAMDSQTENEFKRRFSSWAENKTVVVVTHKLSMLDIVDRVIVVDSGRIIADGPKEKVLRESQSSVRMKVVKE